MATAILEKKAVGIAAWGDVDVTVPDVTGVEHKVRFTWTRKVPVWFYIELETNAYFPADGIEQIQANITNYLKKFTNGQPLYRSMLFEHITKVDGVVRVASLDIAKSPDYSFSAEEITEFTVKQVARADYFEIKVINEGDENE